MPQGPQREHVRPPGRAAFSLLAIVLGALLGTPACRKSREAPPAAPAPEAAAPVSRVDLDSLVARVGAKPGGLTYAGLGPSAAIMGSRGVVTVRRAGEEVLTEVTPNMPLQAGDLVWTGLHAEASVAFADDTLIQMAEQTALVIGNRAIAADPASSAAVIYGVARASISPRARGEGAFLLIAGDAIIGAKGTVVVVAAPADGRVRIGVEHGEVDVAGPAALDKPVTVSTAEVVLLDSKGVVGTPEPFKQDDWGEWRFANERADLLAEIARHRADHLVRTEARLDADYVALQALATTASTLTWRAEANAKPSGLADYKSTAVERAATIEATYRLALEIARLTSAALSDALVLDELYARHPRELEPQIQEFAQEISGTVLYNKKLQLVAEIYLAPMRAAYYAHTARGRARAVSIDLPLPPSAQGKLAELPAGEISKRLPRPLYTPPRVESPTRPHPLWMRAPKAGWEHRLTLQPVPPRQGSWYVAPTQVQASLLSGVAARSTLPLAFASTPAVESAKAELAFLVPPLPPIGPPDGGLP